MARDPQSFPNARNETRLLNAAFWLLLGLQIALPWLAFWFPSQDGPSALYGGHLLNHLLAGDNSLYNNFYQINHRPDPYWISQAALALLLRIAPPVAAEKLFVSLNLLIYGLGIRLLARRLAEERSIAAHGGNPRRPDPGPVSGSPVASLLALPLGLNWVLHMGFYNYTLGFAFSPWLIAAWFAWRRRMSWLSGIGIALFGVAVFLTHLAAWVMCLLAAAAIALSALLKAYVYTRRSAAAPASIIPEIKSFTRSMLPWLPACGLAALFAAHAPPPFPGEPVLYFSFSKLTALATLDDVLVSFGTAERVAAIMLVAAIALIGFGALSPRFRATPIESPTANSPGRAQAWWPAGAVMLAAWLGLYLIAPSDAGGAYYIHRRLMLYPVLGAAMWLGTAPVALRFRTAAAGLAVAAALTQCVSLAVSYRQLAPRQRAFAEALSKLPKNQFIVPIMLTALGVSDDGITPYFDRVRLFAHATSYLAIARNDVDLGDFMTTWEYAPVYIRPKFNTRLYEVGEFFVPPQIHFTAWEKHTGVRVEAVMLYDATRRLMDHPELAALRSELAAFSPLEKTPAKDYQILIRKP